MTPLPATFWAKVEGADPAGCWQWLGCTNSTAEVAAGVLVPVLAGQPD